MLARTLLLWSHLLALAACASARQATRTPPESKPISRQSATADTMCVPSAQLLNRIAAAVDGRLDTTRVWVVYQCTDTGRVIGVATSPADARRLSDSAAAKTYLITTSEYQGKGYEIAVMMGFVDAIVTGCHHSDGSEWRGICGDGRIPRNLVARVTLQIQLRDGRVVSENVPLDVDAVFLSYPAVEKFVFPYYQRVAGLDAVLRMRDAIFDAARRTPRMR